VAARFLKAAVDIAGGKIGQKISAFADGAFGQRINGGGYG
jgi:hypothetical protein